MSTGPCPSDSVRAPAALARAHPAASAAGELRRAAHLEVRFKDGHRETEAIDVPRGSTKNPLTWEDVVAKFKPLVSSSICHDDQLRVIEAVANIEMIDGAGLVAVLRTAVKNKSKDLGTRAMAMAVSAFHS